MCACVCSLTALRLLHLSALCHTRLFSTMDPISTHAHTPWGRNQNRMSDDSEHRKPKRYKETFFFLPHNQERNEDYIINNTRRGVNCQPSPHRCSGYASTSHQHLPFPPELHKALFLLHSKPTEPVPIHTVQLLRRGNQNSVSFTVQYCREY